MMCIATYAIHIICLPFVMFYIACFMFKKKFQEITKDVKNILDSPFIRFSKVREILLDYGVTCRYVEKYNHFWRKFLGLDYFMLTLLASCVLFSGYLEINPQRIPYLTNILFANILMLAFLAYSGDIVSRGVHSPYRALHKLALLNLPKQLKLQVSLCLIKLSFC